MKAIAVIPGTPHRKGSNGKEAKGHTIIDSIIDLPATEMRSSSRGPGTKKYNITVYASSEKLGWPTTRVTRTALLKSIEDITLAEGTIRFRYTRSGTIRWPLIIVGVLLAIIVAYCMGSYRKAQQIGTSVPGPGRPINTETDSP